MDVLRNIPKPLVEEHYEINYLINAQQKRSEDRTRHQNIEKARDSTTKDIQGFKDIELLDFWCNKCQRDFIARARKHLDGWENIAYYKIKHTCGTWAIRRITDRLNDEYWFKSKKVAKDRGNGFEDLLQPWESGYNMIYGKKV